MTNKTETAEVQGTETERLKKYNEDRGLTSHIEKKERKPSLTYAIKSFKTLIEKCEQEKWLKKEDIEQLKRMQKTMVEKYIGISML